MTPPSDPDRYFDVLLQPDSKRATHRREIRVYQRHVVALEEGRYVSRPDYTKIWLSSGAVLFVAATIQQLHSAEAGARFEEARA